MSENLTDIQWCVLDLLMRAKRKGLTSVNRMELMRAPNLPDGVKVQLVFAALLMANGDLVNLVGQHDFQITPKGEKLFDAMFAKPTTVSDDFIALPDQSHRILS